MSSFLITRIAPPGGQGLSIPNKIYFSPVKSQNGLKFLVKASNLIKYYYLALWISIKSCSNSDLSKFGGKCWLVNITIPCKFQEASVFWHPSRSISSLNKLFITSNALIPPLRSLKRGTGVFATWSVHNFLEHEDKQAKFAIFIMSCNIDGFAILAKAMNFSPLCTRYVKIISQLFH